MGPKKVSGKISAQKKMMSVELKREIIEKNERGVRVVDLARQYGRSTSTICTVLKQKESIKGITLAKGVTILSKLRSSLHENMEKLLMVWMTEKQLKGDTLTRGIICEKARAIYGDLLNQTQRTSTDEASDDSFKASRGWFDNFRKRSGIHFVVGHDEAASLDVKTDGDYLETFSELIEAKGYIPQQVFNCHETGVFWKKMPNRTCITAEEKMMTAHNAMKEEPEVKEESEAEEELEVNEEPVVKEEPEVDEEPEMEEFISTSEIKEILGMWERVSQFVGKKHPEKVATDRASELFNDTCLTHFRNILKARNK